MGRFVSAAECADALDKGEHAVLEAEPSAALIPEVVRKISVAPVFEQIYRGCWLFAGGFAWVLDTQASQPLSDFGWRHGFVLPALLILGPHAT